MTSLTVFWDLVTENMSHDDLTQLRGTNRAFEEYIRVNENRLYKRLLRRSFPCLQSPKEMYLLLSSVDAASSVPYKELCRKHAMALLPCDRLIESMGKTLKEMRWDSGMSSTERIQKFMQVYNSVLQCVDKLKQREETDPRAKFHIRKLLQRRGVLQLMASKLDGFRSSVEKSTGVPHHEKQAIVNWTIVTKQRWNDLFPLDAEEESVLSSIFPQ